MKHRYCGCGSTAVSRCYIGPDNILSGKAANGYSPAWICNDCGYVMEKCRPRHRPPSALSKFWFRHTEYRRYVRESKL